MTHINYRIPTIQSDEDFYWQKNTFFIAYQALKDNYNAKNATLWSIIEPPSRLMLPEHRLDYLKEIYNESIGVIQVLGDGDEKLGWKILNDLEHYKNKDQECIDYIYDFLECYNRSKELIRITEPKLNNTNHIAVKQANQTGAAHQEDDGIDKICRDIASITSTTTPIDDIKRDIITLKKQGWINPENKLPIIIIGETQEDKARRALLFYCHLKNINPEKMNKPKKKKRHRIEYTKDLNKIFNGNLTPLQLRQAKLKLTADDLKDFWEMLNG